MNPSYLKIKTFSHDNPAQLDEQVDEWLDKMHDSIKIEKIEFGTSGTNHFSYGWIMIVYTVLMDNVSATDNSPRGETLAS